MLGLLVSALVGALAGFVAWFFTKRLPPRHQGKANVLRVAIVVGAFTVSQQLLTPALEHRDALAKATATGLEMFGRETVARAYAEGLLRVVESRTFRDRLKSMSKPPTTALTELTASGLTRLPLDDAEELLRIRLALASASPSLCAGFWSGATTDPKEMTRALRALDERTQLAFTRSIAHSLELELAQAPTHSPAPEGLQAAIDGTAGALEGPEREAFVRAVNARGKAEANDGCTAYKALVGRLPRMPAAQREAVVRALLFVEPAK